MLISKHWISAAPMSATFLPACWTNKALLPRTDRLSLEVLPTTVSYFYCGSLAWHQSIPSGPFGVACILADAYTEDIINLTCSWLPGGRETRMGESEALDCGIRRVSLIMLHEAFISWRPRMARPYPQRSLLPPPASSTPRRNPSRMPHKHLTKAVDSARNGHRDVLQHSSPQSHTPR